MTALRNNEKLRATDAIRHLPAACRWYWLYGGDGQFADVPPRGAERPDRALNCRPVERRCSSKADTRSAVLADLNCGQLAPRSAKERSFARDRIKRKMEYALGQVSQVTACELASCSGVLSLGWRLTVRTRRWRQLSMHI
jgi:hypothetical protein